MSRFFKHDRGIVLCRRWFSRRSTRFLIFSLFFTVLHVRTTVLYATFSDGVSRSCHVDEKVVNNLSTSRTLQANSIWVAVILCEKVLCCPSCWLLFFQWWSRVPNWCNYPMVLRFSLWLENQLRQTYSTGLFLRLLMLAPSF